MAAVSSTLIFVYNADHDLFSRLTDLAHKLFSPQTYACHLCALTHSTMGMRNEWKTFLQSLQMPVEFWHRDEWTKCGADRDVALPAVFLRQGDSLQCCLEARTIQQCRTIEELKQLILEKLQ